MRGTLRLLGGARVSLLPGLEVVPLGLRESITGAVHETSPVGVFVLRHLDGTRTCSELRDELVSRFGIAPMQAAADLAEFICDLDESRLVSTRQSWLLEFGLRIQLLIWNVVALLQFQRQLHVWRFPARRYPSSQANVLRAVLEAHQGSLYMGIGAAVGLGSVSATRDLLVLYPHSHRLSDTTLTTVMCVVAATLLLVLSAFAHELGHYWVANCVGVRVSSVFARMGVSGVTHAETASASRNALVTAAGPFIAIMVTGLLTMSMYMLSVVPQGMRSGMLVAGAAVVVLHARSLTPFSVEGRRLMRYAIGSRHMRLA